MKSLLFQTRTAICALLIVFAGLLGPSTARATLIGDNISGSGFLLGPSSATIGAGTEFYGLLGLVNFDFGANTLTLTTNSSWDLPIILVGSYVFTGFDDTITGFNVASTGGWGGTVVNNPLFSGHSLTLDLNATWAKADSKLIFNIETATRVPDNGATVAMVGICLLGLASLRRKILS